MHLEKQPEFERILDRFCAWWNCQIIDRPPVSMDIRPLRAVELPAKHHADARERWLDGEYQLDCFEAQLAVARFVGDTFPKFTPNLGPDLVATLFGADLTFGERTSWSTPIGSSCREILEMQPDWDGPYWSWIRRMTDMSLQRGAGRWLTGIADLHTNGDLLAALRGPQDLCLELVDDLEGVRLACEHVTNFFGRMYDDLWSRLDAAGQPAAGCFPMIGPGRMYMISCDFICLISPQMYESTILPAHRREIAHLDWCMFHLDGPGALKHLDTILSLEGLNGLQWVYGAGKGPGARWIEVYRKAQAAGKCIQVKAADTQDAETLMEHLKPEGVWFTVGGEYEPDEARAFIERVARWAAGKRA